MAQITSYDGVPIVDAIVIGPDGQPGYSQTAQLGQPGFSNVIVDDPLGSMTFETWKDWTVDEDDCTFERLYTGIIYAIRVDRGPYRDGPGRKWYLDIVDMGQLLKQRVISGADGQRPFEMDTTRINWLYNSDYLDGLVFDNGFLNVTDNPQGQFDTDHRFEYPMDVFVSVAGPISKHAFVYWDAVAEEPSIFYDRFDVSLGAAGIGFSNVMSDVDETTVFYPKVDAEATYDGEDRYGGLMLGWRGPPVYRTLDSTVLAMGRTRDVVFQTDRIGLASTASSVTSLLLAQHADDLVSIKFSAELPSSAVRLAREGQTMEVRFEHIPGFETTQEVFIRSTIIQQIVAGRYLVQFDVAPNPTVPLVPTGGDPGELPPEMCEPTFTPVQTVHDTTGVVFTFASDPTPGNTTTITAWHRSGSDPSGPTFAIPGFTLIDYAIAGLSDQNERVAIWYRHVESGDVAEFDLPSTYDAEVRLFAAEWQGTWTPMTGAGQQFIDNDVDWSSPQAFTLGTVVTAGPALLIGAFCSANNVNDPQSAVANDATIEQLDVSGAACAGGWQGYRGENDAGTYEIEITATSGGIPRGYGSFVVAFETDCEDSCLATGQPSGIETVTLTGADGTTRCPFADGSLHVYIDNVEQTDTLVSQDGETGDFTLGFDPTPTEVCTVTYLGR